MYQSQPLFTEVDSFLRDFGFMLFDLQRYRVRRRHFPKDFRTRGQLLWGQAFYLKDYLTLTDRSYQSAYKLAILSSFFGFHDYALEVIDSLLTDEGWALTSEEIREVKRRREEYVNALKNSRRIERMIRIARSPLRKPFLSTGTLLCRLADAFHFVVKQRKYFWKD
jgi:hypothetical protein